MRLIVCATRRARARAAGDWGRQLVVVMMTVIVIVTVIVMVMTVVVVLRTVAGLIFGGLHEIHRSLTGMVFVAVLVPVLGALPIAT